MIFYWWGFLGILHLLVSTLTFWCIYRGRTTDFKTPYYRMLQTDLVINIVCHVHSWIKRFSTDDELSRFLIPVGKHAEFLLMINDFLSQYFYHVQSMSMLTKCFCQFQTTRDMTVLISWQKYWPRAYIGNIVASGLVTVPYAVISHLKTVSYDPKADKLVFDPEPWKQSYWIMDLEILFYLFSICAIGAATFFMIHLHPDWKKAKVMKTKVTALTFINAIMHTAVFCWHFIPRYMEMQNSTRVIMLFCVSDLITCTLPYMLFACDKKFRRAFLLLVFDYKTIEVRPTEMAPRRKSEDPTAQNLTS